MPRQRRPVVEDDVESGIERERRQSLEAKDMTAMEILELAVGPFEIELGRGPAQQAQRHGAIGGMALPCKSQRAVQGRADGRCTGAGGMLPQETEELACRRHRSHRVRGRRPDADLEDVEDAEKHRRPLVERNPGAGGRNAS